MKSGPEDKRAGAVSKTASRVGRTHQVRQCLVCLINPISKCVYCGFTWCRQCHDARTFFLNGHNINPCTPRDREIIYDDGHFTGSI